MVDVPSPGTPLLGRDHEVANAAGLLLGDARLVTVTGPGGVGKTRLAVAVAQRVGAGLRDGAVFVDLAGVTDPNGVAPAIAGTLEVGQSGTDEPAVALRQALTHRALLLVLDNFEQVLPAAPVPAALVERCPDLRILVTSRAPLRVRAERVFRLAALPVPIRSAGCDVVEMQQFASVELFCERAGAIRTDFRLDEDNAGAIAAICRAVDGLPLALELAAARVSHLQPGVLAERLATPVSTVPLDTLARGANDLPARQRTMRDTVAWSYNLLSAPEQCLLRRMAIFDGDCSLDAVEFVCSDPTPQADTDVALAETTLLDALATLVDLHLVEPDDRVPDEPRFAMLVTIREFGREQLEIDAERAGVAEMDLRSKHARYYAALVDEAARGLESPAARSWGRRLEHELVEIRASLRYLLDTEDIVVGLRMVTAAGRFWLNHGHIAEGRQWLADFLDGVSLERLPGPERARALMWTARLAIDEVVSGEAARTAILAQFEQARALALSIEDEQLELEALLFLTPILRPDGDFDGALALAEAGIARARLVNRWRLAELSHSAALLAHWAGQHERAAALATEACTLADELGNERLSLAARITLSFTTPGTSHAGAAPELTAIVPRAEDLGDKRLLAWLYPAVGFEAFSAGRVADSARWLQTSLELARDSGYWRAGAFGMMGAQLVSFVRGRPEAAARLFGVLSPHLATLRRAAPPAHLHTWEGFIDAVREAMGDQAFHAAARAGSVLSWDAALSEAMTICESAIKEPSEPRARSTRPHRSWDLELTERELDVLRLIAAGGTNKDVAAALGIRAKTVMHHSVAIYRKLGVRGRAEATAYAYRNNLIPASEPA